MTTLCQQEGLLRKYFECKIYNADCFDAPFKKVRHLKFGNAQESSEYVSLIDKLLF
jgi:hypothetical protein